VSPAAKLNPVAYSAASRQLRLAGAAHAASNQTSVTTVLRSKRGSITYLGGGPADGSSEAAAAGAPPPQPARRDSTGMFAALSKSASDRRSSLELQLVPSLAVSASTLDLLDSTAALRRRMHGPTIGGVGAGGGRAASGPAATARGQ
jgi:hypothetical protein